MIGGLFSCQNSETITLVNNGKSEYTIIIAESADTLTRFAAAEFRKYFNEATGVLLVIKSDSEPESDFEVLIGNNARTNDSFPQTKTLHEDGFIIKTEGNKLFIMGGVDKGALYGVYTFLEDYLGCRKYSMTEVVVPKTDKVAFQPIDIKQEPAFHYRELHMPLPKWDREYLNWHKLDLKEGKNEWGLFVHTFDDFIPAEKYFKSHPEYFSWLNVQRIPDGQHCLSNPDVFDIVVEKLRKRMYEKPEALYWSVSQNDTYKACECDVCREEYQQYGGYSGAMIHFVNKIAAEFPDKIISTLAYQYTRSAPLKIKPADNVNIMFCSIECNRSRSLASDPLSASFRKDTEDWCKLTDNIFMWDYVVQFRNLVCPFPNLHVLQPNIQYFRDNGIQMMFQQGSGGLISEFVELRSYIIAKLLWDPDVDVEEIMNDFLEGYYGPAGKFIGQYIDLMHAELTKSGGDLGIYGYPFDGINTYLTPELIKKYNHLFDEAENSVAENQKFLQRAKIARLPLEFAILDISLRNVNDELTYFYKEGDNWLVKEDMLARLDQLTKLAKEAGIERYWEHGNYPDDYKATVERYARTSMQKHLALNKPTQLLTESSQKYPVGGAGALTDGLKGVNDYHFNWLGFEGPDMIAVIDLESEIEIHSIEVDFFQEIKSWVFLPDKVEIYFSNTNEDFKLTGIIKNDVHEKKDGTFIKTYKNEFDKVKTRYIKIIAINQGICPDWHPGAGYPSWIFCDEVVVW
ncbi:MAG: DUF4838 domain-containing protein [Bacteroidales bacterium]|nr:DUF4838 domain-containing protein [Bacteroidales bacterium]